MDTIALTERRAIWKSKYYHLNNLWRTIMTKLETMNTDIIPGFDVLAWKEKIQAEILEETKGMTREQIREYFRKGSEAFLAERSRFGINKKETQQCQQR
jgi:hypothetical protein